MVSKFCSREFPNNRQAKKDRCHFLPMPAYIHENMNTHVHMYVHACLHTYIYTQIRTYEYCTATIRTKSEGFAGPYQSSVVGCRIPSNSNQRFNSSLYPLETWPSTQAEGKPRNPKSVFVIRVSELQQIADMGNQAE